MSEFSILSFIEHLGVMGAELVVAEAEGLHKAAEIVKAEAKASVGEYQPQSGPFAAWAPLADATKVDRVSQGYPEDEPELRSGALRDSIESTVLPNMREAEVGSDSDVMVYQELGTAKMPPRSILGGAAARREQDVVDLLSDRAVIALLPTGMTPKMIRS